MKTETRSLPNVFGSFFILLSVGSNLPAFAAETWVNSLQKGPVTADYHTGAYATLSGPISYGDCSGWNVYVCTFRPVLAANLENYQITSIDIANGTTIYNNINDITITAILGDGSRMVLFDGDPGLGRQTLSFDPVSVSDLEFALQGSTNRSGFSVENVHGSYIGPTFYCNGQAASVVGTSLNDTLLGTVGDDVIVALDGGDHISGGKGNDTICGGEGNDHIAGGPGDDDLFGESGNDFINGGKNNDYCDGGSHKKRDVIANCE